ncbi:terminal nucleotidyltransferase 4B-like [Impatiens glandulifera]|uniref:terminal nucleotidyltransferase 4B-like n=1 Tax=Impatiens glandulifera TaxID=253017 RepID=UPI001FB14E38|nr:terminal nucleotidyltransferase 4B-like [Impatiens glandulifera]
MEAKSSTRIFNNALRPMSSAGADSPAGEPSVVFRKGVSLSASRGTLPEPASLDHRAVKEPERTLERGLLSRRNCQFKSPMLQLHKEILDFSDFLSPTPEERELRHSAVARVFDVIRRIWPNSKGEVFGSFRTGLYLPTSDIDVVILGSEIRTHHALNDLSDALSREGIAKNIKVIAKARIPIIKFVETRSEIPFDISFNVENGPKAADFIKDAVARWPPLRPLCLVLKVFLQQRDLNEVYTGGIGSYALLTMLIAMLRNLSQYETREQNLGILLVHFFEIYGCKLNISNVGVSCNRTGTFFNKSSIGCSSIGQTFSLCLEDPQAPENDIGKNSFNFFQVRSAFSMALSTITNVKTIISLGSSKSILGTIIRPDRVLLARKGGYNGDMTFEETLPGSEDQLMNYHLEEIYNDTSDDSSRSSTSEETRKTKKMRRF